jgi:hypothetical protein
MSSGKTEFDLRAFAAAKASAVAKAMADRSAFTKLRRTGWRDKQDGRRDGQGGQDGGGITVQGESFSRGRFQDAPGWRPNSKKLSIFRDFALTLSSVRNAGGQ